MTDNAKCHMRTSEQHRPRSMENGELRLLLRNKPHRFIIGRQDCRVRLLFTEHAGTHRGVPTLLFGHRDAAMLRRACPMISTIGKCPWLNYVERLGHTLEEQRVVFRTCMNKKLVLRARNGYCRIYFGVQCSEY